jgi:hypothetical protein
MRRFSACLFNDFYEVFIRNTKLVGIKLNCSLFSDIFPDQFAEFQIKVLFSFFLFRIGIILFFYNFSGFKQQIKDNGTDDLFRKFTLFSGFLFKVLQKVLKLCRIFCSRFYNTVRTLEKRFISL